VLLPYNNATLFVRNLRAHRTPLATWTAWVSPATLKPADVARQVGMSESELRAVNRIPPRMLVKTGSTLLVPRSPHKTADVSEQVADNARMLLAPDRPPGRRVSFKAGKGGDSVAAVARRHRVSAEQVAQWNDVGTDAHFKPGQSIVVMKPVAARRGKAAAAVTSAKPAAAKAPAKRTAAAKPAAKPSAKVAGSKPNSKL
jgi:membrane-bound lytic murein transglycosylase D